jgi:hypothetical protein
MALAGVATRFWSPSAAPAGRTPGTTRASVLLAARTSATSCGEHTMPAAPAFSASFARRTTASRMVPAMPSARRSSSDRLVSTVTPRMPGLPLATSTALRIISKPPAVCTVSSSAPRLVAEATARATVSGMSCSFRSRKTLPPRFCTASTARCALGHEELQANLVETRLSFQAIEESGQARHVRHVERHDHALGGGMTLRSLTGCPRPARR